MVNVERLVQRDLDRWIHLLGLGSWKISWELVDYPIDKSGDTVAHNDYHIRKTGRKDAHIRFDRFHLRSAAEVEKTVIHELLHIFDWGIGNDAHKLIYRLEVPLRRMRQRTSK